RESAMTAASSMDPMTGCMSGIAIRAAKGSQHRARLGPRWLHGDDVAVPEGAAALVQGGHRDVALVGAEIDRGLEPPAGRGADRAHLTAPAPGMHAPVGDLGGAVPADVGGGPAAGAV